MSSGVYQIIANRRSFYAGKLNTFLAWSTKKCSMNGTSDKYIRNMLSQMLKELSISSSSSSSIINTIYSRDFDATKLVNIISKASCVFDLLNKDTSIREYSVDSALYALETCGVHVSNFNNVQRAGICIFVQFILCGGRNELEGFGVSTNLVEKWKKNQIVQKKKVSTENSRRTKHSCPSCSC